MATIDGTTAEFSDDGLLVEFDVLHPVHEAGAWFIDTVTVVGRTQHNRKTISHDRQVDAALNRPTKFHVTSPPISVDRSWAPLTVTVRTLPRAPLGDHADPIVVKVPS